MLLKPKRSLFTGLWEDTCRLFFLCVGTRMCVRMNIHLHAGVRMCAQFVSVCVCVCMHVVVHAKACISIYVRACACVNIILLVPRHQTVVFTLATFLEHFVMSSISMTYFSNHLVPVLRNVYI